MRFFGWNVYVICSELLYRRGVDWIGDVFNRQIKRDWQDASITIETPHLNLVPKTPDELRAMIDGMSSEEKVQLAPDWLALIQAATEPDPWLHGFTIRLREADVLVGNCGFKAPPNAEGVVEIAYGIDPDYQGKGYATEAATGLVDYACSHAEVRRVCAHTLPEENASTRVLTKCGFRKTGEVMDRDDGLVWRWEKPKD
jgi:ribosomal-protein-alanine N-acetyltransferase